MITKPTVFILGAGASMPYNFPSGPELVRRIIKTLHFDKDKMESQPDSIMANRDIQKIVNEDHSLESIHKFVRALWQSNTASIDEFMHQRQEYSDIAKLAITQEIMRYEKEERLVMNINKLPIELSDNEQERWYVYLWHLMTDGADFASIGNNEVSFINFNYDRSLEHFLYISMLNFYGKNRLETARQLNKISIIHPYGKLGRLGWETNPEGVFNSYSPSLDKNSSLGDIAKNVSVLYDAGAGLANKDKIESIINRADNIHFLGFGYHRMNLEVLCLNEYNNHVLSGTAYVLTKVEQGRAIRRFGLSDKKITLKTETCLNYLRGEELC